MYYPISYVHFWFGVERVRSGFIKSIYEIYTIGLYSLISIDNINELDEDKVEDLAGRFSIEKRKLWELKQYYNGLSLRW